MTSKLQLLLATSSLLVGLFGSDSSLCAEQTSGPVQRVASGATPTRGNERAGR